MGKGSGVKGKAWTARIEAALTRTLDALNGDAMSRDPARFRTLLGGKTGAVTGEAAERGESPAEAETGIDRGGEGGRTKQ